jgi:hypothetical protein
VKDLVDLCCLACFGVKRGLVRDKEWIPSVFSKLRQVGLDSPAAASSINLVHFDF